MARLRTGQPLLSCHETCVAEWRSAQPRAAELDATARWPELATLLIDIGFQDDLSLYYLGRAAEGMGYPGAAASYYRQSTYVSGGSISCQHLSRMCGGVALPRAASLRLAAIDRELHRTRPRRAGPTTPSTETPDPVPSDLRPPLPSEPEPTADAVAAPPIAGTLPLPPSEIQPPAVIAAPPPLPEPAASVPRRTGPAPSEYIEPPAVGR